MHQWMGSRAPPFDALNTTVPSLSKGERPTSAFIILVSCEGRLLFFFLLGQMFLTTNAPHYFPYQCKGVLLLSTGRRKSFLLFLSDMSQARLPAEFKHISKRRKRNQMGFP